MDDDEFKEDDDDIHKIGVENKDFHNINKKTYKFEIDYDPDEGDGEYSSRLSIDVVFLPTGSYTMVFEMYFDDGLNVEQLNATSGTLTINKQFLTTTKNKIKNIIQFTKSIIHPSLDDLDIDIKLTGKNDSKTTIYVVVFGVNKHVDYISDKLGDRLYYFEADHLKLEVPIDMNNQNIINVADGVDDNDVVTRKQLNILILSGIIILII